LPVVDVAICEAADPYPLVPAAYNETEAPATVCDPAIIRPFNAGPVSVFPIVIVPEIAFVVSA
jgi:hypothetical protein